MSRIVKHAVTVSALAFALVGTAAAQAPERGLWELGGYGRYTPVVSSDQLNLTPGWGAGGRLGYFIASRWALEGELAFSRMFRWSTGENVDDVPWRLRVAYHQPMGEMNRLILGAGYTGESWELQNFPSRSSNQYGAVLGWQWAMSELFALRLQGAYDRFAASESYAKSEKGNLMSFEFGLTWPGGGPRDSDRDGVVNRWDSCPNTVPGDAVDVRGCALPKDADSDGVVDASDMCAGTPRGDQVDARGCSLPKDADGDGVVDGTDRCAATPAGTPVDANGCPRDTDGDGVTDNNDRCAGTAAGTPVDASGCALPDTDGDGVLDRDDRCAGTPAGMRVDARGCQLLFDTSAGATALVLEGVTFATGSATLADSSKPVLDRVAESLVANSAVRVEVQGHTDNSGSAATNRRLSQRRADAVRAYLVGKGVDAARLTAMGYGPDQPKVPNTSAANRAQNRRVELKQIP